METLIILQLLIKIMVIKIIRMTLIIVIKKMQS